MELSKLKAAMQLAKMRMDADPTDENTEKHEAAETAYQNAGALENEGVSGKPAKKPAAKAASAAKPSVSPKAVTEPSESSDDAGDTDQSDDTEGDQKKTKGVE